MTIAIIQISLPFFGEEDKTDAEKYRPLNEKLNGMLKECVKACSNAGIKTGKVTGIRINPGLNSSWGRCITDRIEGTHEIEINKVLLDESVPDLSLKKVILHELCHTVRDGHGHKNGWLIASKKLEHTYGIRLSAVSSAEELRIPE